MHRYVKAIASIAGQQEELFIGEVLQASVNEDLRVEAVHVSNESFIDIGTPDHLLKAPRQFMARIE
jgi:hypothetical protein